MDYQTLCKSYSQALVRHVERNMPEWVILKDSPLRALRDLSGDMQECNDLFPLQKYLKRLVASGELIEAQVEFILSVSELDAEMERAIQDAFSAAELDLMNAVARAIADIPEHDPFDDMTARDYERIQEIRWGA
jgi:hypothetical protein